METRKDLDFLLFGGHCREALVCTCESCLRKQQLVAEVAKLRQENVDLRSMLEVHLPKPDIFPVEVVPAPAVKREVKQEPVVKQELCV